MTEIPGDHSVSPQRRGIYKQECYRGVKLFQESLDEYQKSTLEAQKEKYRDVMEKAMEVIRETAAQCLSQELQKEEKNLQKDYSNFMSNPSPTNLQKLQQDLTNFEKRI